MNVSFDSKYWLYFSRRAGQVMLRQKSNKKGDPKTLPAAGRDVHRPDFIGINCFRVRGGGRLSYVLL